MEYYITNEEMESLKLYRETSYEPINQMLTSNSDLDVAYIKKHASNADALKIYSKESVEKYIDIVKKVFELMQKVYYSNNVYTDKVLYRGTNTLEIGRIIKEPYIDRFLSATNSKNVAEGVFAKAWNEPAVMEITLPKNIPYINVNDILDLEGDNEEYLISPFTILKEIEEITSDEIKEYEITLEKQELEKLFASERAGLYSYIINTADVVGIKLKEMIELDNINSENYEDIKKLEKLLENDKTNSQEDIDDINRINKQLTEIKDEYTKIEVEQRNIVNFITNWKRNIVVYLMAECKEIEEKYIVNFEKEEVVIVGANVKELGTSNSFINGINPINTIQNQVENETNIKSDVETEEKINKGEVSEKLVEENMNEMNNINVEKEIIYKDIKDEEDENSKKFLVKKECKENIEASEKLLENIKTLITKQQNHAKVAGNLGTTYSALNNGFEMRNVAEDLNALLKNIKLKLNVIIEEEENEKKLEEKLENISEVNIQISTLLNYLNNPKSSIGIANITRFDEMTIIEENELKKGIYQNVRDIMGEAELKKLKDDYETIEGKSPFERLIGIFTGKNRLDEIILDQIEIRQNAIRKTLSQKLSIANNYSIHEIAARIKMFIDENYDDELIKKDVEALRELDEKLKKNFVILETKVESIITEKDGKYLPVDNKKTSKREKIENDTYKFLNKYGYDIKEENSNIVYQDTMASEISRIIEYINSSNIL